MRTVYSAIPDPYDRLKPTGCVRESFPRGLSGPMSSLSTGLVSGTLVCQAIPFQGGETVSTLRLYSGDTGATAPTHQWTVILDSTLHPLVYSANKTTEAWNANAEKAFTLTAPWTCPTSDLYYIGLCVVAGTVPHLRGGFVGGVVDARAPIVAGRSNTGLTDPASLTAALVSGAATALTAVGNRFYAGAY